MIRSTKLYIIYTHTKLYIHILQSSCKDGDATRSSIRKCWAQIGIAIIEIILFEKGEELHDSDGGGGVAGDEIVSFRFRVSITGQTTCSP